MTEHLMTVDGERRSSADRFDVINPATGEPFATAPGATAADLDDAMAGAQRAFRTWRLDDDARREALRQAAAAINEATPQIATLLTQEQGKPLNEAMFEVMGVGMWLQYYADLPVEREILQDDDADPGLVGKALFTAAFRNNGQTCIAVTRVHVPESLHDAVVDALVAEAESVVVGDGMEEGTQLGPLDDRPQFDRVSDLVTGALSSGARAAAGGAALDRPGCFFAPTILTDAGGGTGIVAEEQFGPALPVIAYRDLDDAVERANATTYALGASVWATDTERGESVARQLETGSAWVNRHASVAPHLPFGGLGWSGVGVENGTWGYKSFTDLQVVNRRKK